MPEREDVDIARFDTTRPDNIEDVISIINELKSTIGTIETDIDIQEASKVIEGIKDHLKEREVQTFETPGTKIEILKEASIKDIESQRDQKVDLTEEKKKLQETINKITPKNIIDLIDDSIRNPDVDTILRDLRSNILPETEYRYSEVVKEIIQDRDEEMGDIAEKYRDLTTEEAFPEQLFRGTGSRELTGRKIGDTVHLINSLIKSRSYKQELLGTSLTTKPSIAFEFFKGTVIRIDERTLRNSVSLLYQDVDLSEHPEIIYRVIDPERIKGVLLQQSDLIEQVADDLMFDISQHDTRRKEFPARSIEELDQYRKRIFATETGQYYQREYEEFKEIIDRQELEGPRSAVINMFKDKKKGFVMQMIDEFGTLPHILLAAQARRIIEAQEEITTVGPTEIPIESMVLFVKGTDLIKDIRAQFGGKLEIFNIEQLKRLADLSGEPLADIVRKPREELRKFTGQKPRVNKSRAVVRILQHILSRIDISVKYNILQTSPNLNPNISRLIAETSNQTINEWIKKLEALI